MAGRKSHRAIALVGSSKDCPDIEYATNFRAHDPVVYVQTGRREYLVVPTLELGRARQAVTGPRPCGRSSRIDVVTPQSLGCRERTARRISGWLLAALVRENVRRITVPAQLAVGIARRLERAGIRVCIAKGPLFPERAVKSAQELRYITESQQAAVLAMRAAVGMMAGAQADGQGRLRHSGGWLTAEALHRRVAEVLLARRAMCPDVICAPGPQGADPHLRGTGPILVGVPVVIDIFPQHMDHGYWGDLTRTVVRGSASARLKRMYHAVKAAQAAALAAIRPGVKSATVHRAAADVLEQRGFRTGEDNGRPYGFFHGTGHGVGLQVHESPSLGISDTRLRKGHVVTVEPGLYYADIGGVRIEDTVQVTGKGWRYLVPCEKRFEL